MSLLVKGRREGRDIVTVTPASAGWKYVGFAAHRLAPGEELAFATGRNEVCVVVLRGVVTVAVPAGQLVRMDPALVLSPGQAHAAAEAFQAVLEEAARNG